MLFLLLKNEIIKISKISRLYCLIILYCNFQLGLGKSVRGKEVSAKNCPLHKGFLIRILDETNPFLNKVSARGKCPL